MIDQYILDTLTKSKYKQAFYPQYFNTEIKTFSGQILIENNDFVFQSKKQIGENDHYVSEMIRKDLIEEFIIYVHKKNLPLYLKIKRSIFETNLFLLDKEPSFIEYAAFYGSIQIFKYLLLNGVELTPSLWLYSTHSESQEIYEILCENQIIPNNNSFREILIESIKCHHNNAANFIISNYFTDEYEFIISNVLKFYNFLFLPTDLNDDFIFFNLCKYNYTKIVELLLKKGNININAQIISTYAFSRNFYLLIKWCLFIYNHKTALHIAIENENIDITFKIIYFFNKIKKQINGTPLYIAAEIGNFEIFNTLLNYKNILLGKNVLRGCSELTHIEIPSFITSIGEGSFSYCTNLTKISIPKGLVTIGDYSFCGCLLLQRVAIPNSTTFIGKCAFYRCWSLKEVVISSSIRTIHEYTFFECTSLVEIKIPSSVKSIESHAFCKCLSLQKVTISNNATTIGNHCFQDCISLSQFELPNSITKIESYTFSGCKSLTEITVPSTVISIDNGSFSGCTSLISVVFKSSVKFIGEGAFSWCLSLKKVTLPSSLAVIENYLFTNCVSLTEFEVPPSVKSIGHHSFASCTSLRRIFIPKSVTFIGDSAFSFCSSLNQISIPSSVKSIDNYAFYECSSLNKISIPSMKVIGKHAFRCRSHRPTQVIVVADN